MTNANVRPSTQASPLRVVHMTTVHPPFDSRIFHKECRSLSERGFDVSLLAVHDADIEVDGVRIVALEPASGRIARMTSSALRLLGTAWKQNADVYHFHDPELLTVGFVLRLLGKTVIYDVHEDLPLDLLSKTYLPPLAGRMASRAARMIHWFADRVLSGVVTVTTEIGEPFSNPTVVRNYPLLSEFDRPAAAYRDRPEAAVYVGAIGPIRGSTLMREATDIVTASGDRRLLLAGMVPDPALRNELESLPNGSSVSYLGILDRAGVVDLLQSARIGLVILDDSNRAFHTTFPVKLFEYMAAGLPVIVCDIPKWADVVRAADCGIVVGSTDVGATANAMAWLYDHPDEAEAMGRRGRAAVEAEYNWDAEADSLERLYRRVTS